MRPEFSVIIPVHNKLPHLERSVFSVLNQTFSSFELILIDDASTDGSSEKLLEFKDSRIKLLRRDVPGPGGYAARNFGVKHASYKWVCFLDADDEWELNVLDTLAEVIKDHPDVEILSWGWVKAKGRQKVIDAYSCKFKQEKIKPFTLTDFFNGPPPMWTGGISMKKELLEKAGGFPEHGFKRGGDMDTWIRCLWHSNKSLRLTKPMTLYYMDSVNMVTKSIENDTSYFFSDFVMQILQSTKDKQLVQAIRYHQNRRIYSILTERLNKGRSIDYDLLSKMNTNLLFCYLFVKLHLKELFLRTKFMKGSAA
ncbi:glycosyltransferase family 2 protein [Pontibacter silvestris]|uniref:Glycosyltransferase family 2 protein n=1 Tax=Pontibacter silvestris TaxID=2305183 RepID=A0ABW4WZQ4_9BACT|nr:glycosyltransferase family A protein [Pontibacter silvestris]MCC9138545.1 glycosyltransferase family 2 protein [Pontibacter silvestris]